MAGKFKYQNKYDVNVCKPETSLLTNFKNEMRVFSAKSYVPCDELLVQIEKKMFKGP